MNFSNTKIGVRLGSGFGLVLFLMLMLTAIAITRLSEIGELTDKIIEKDWVKSEAVNIINSSTRANARRTMELLLNTDTASHPKIRERISINKKSIDDAIVTLDQLVYAPEGKALLAKIKEDRAKFAASFNKVDKLVSDTLQAEATTLMLTETLPALDTLQASINDMALLQKKLVETSGANARKTITAARVWMLVLAVSATLIGIAFAYWISRSITRPLNQAVQVAQTVASGDLTSQIEITSSDEAGQLLQALKSMNDSLLNIVGEVRSGTSTIATASIQIANGNLDLSSRTEEQASSLEETASSMEELTSTVKQNADNARQANQLAATASEVAQKGGTVVSEVVVTMNSINESSMKIVDIISVIDGIAFQTNILALNAAVEAARAGEQGRGFAVVATEVRNLAQRSAAAAKEIKTLIGDSVNKVSVGNKLVEQAGTTMQEIVDSIQRVTDVMAEISAASHEQTGGIEQINQAIMQMDDVTQQNAALVEQAAAAAASLQNQAGHLEQVVSVFKTQGIKISHIAPASVANIKDARRTPELAPHRLLESVKHQR